ncbi:MAG: FliH/SctL family protein [Syntrophomonadales bacterium]
MSKVIKPHEIILQAPVFIEIPDQTAAVEDQFPVEVSPDVSQAAAQEEAERIIKETEEMIVQILEKARLEAQNIMAEAREEAQVIRVKAEKEAVLLKEQAMNNGYQSGWERAREEARQQLEQANQQSKDLLEAANRERLDIIRSCEKIIIQMSMDIARKIVEKELTTNSDIIVKLVGSIMEYMNGADAFKILVSPEDFAILVKEFGEHTGLSGGDQKIQVLADQKISRGGCIVETDLGSVDARLETRISSLEDSLMDVVRYE